MEGGRPVSAQELAGRWYRGTSLGLPEWVERLAWKTFAKTFHPTASGVMGWNVRLCQDGLEAPPVPMKRRGAPLVFGFYRVNDGPVLELDYGVRPNPLLDPTRMVRDPLVALGGGVLLGRTWVSFVGIRLPTPSFFVLEPAGAIPGTVIDAARARGLGG